MKQLLITCLVLLFFLPAALSQQTPYQYHFWTATYEPLVGAVDVSDWANFSDYQVPLGFSFSFDNHSYTSLPFDFTQGTMLNATVEYDTIDAILAFNSYAFLTDNPGSAVRYKTEGTAPYRVCKIEWYKVGFDAADGVVSFQLWVYETTNVIQIHLGSMVVPEPAAVFFNENSPMIGVMTNYLFDNTLETGFFTYSHWVVGDPAAPTDSIVVNTPLVGDAPIYGCTGLPLENSVFTFTPGDVLATHAATFQTGALSVYPNPVTSSIHFSSPIEVESNVQCVNLQGQTVYSTALPAGAASIDLPATLPDGIYLLQRVNGTLLESVKILRVK